MRYKDISDRIGVLCDEYNDLSRKLKAIKTMIDEHTENTKALDNYNLEYNSLSAKMPKVCPLCGSKL